MTLPLPQLDKRNWSDLLAEGLARIPRRAPDWTDHNLHDPGITLVELLAYKTEQLLYQSNRVSQRLLRNVVGLLDPQTPTSPTSVLWFSYVNAITRLPIGQIFEQQLVGDESHSLVPRRLQITDVSDPSRAQNSNVNDNSRLRTIDLLPLSDITVTTNRDATTDRDTTTDRHATTDRDATTDVTQRLYAGRGFSTPSQARANPPEFTLLGAAPGLLKAPSRDQTPFSQPLFTIALKREVKRQQQQGGVGMPEQGTTSERRTNCQVDASKADDSCVNFGIYFEIESDTPSQTVPPVVLYYSRQGKDVFVQSRSPSHTNPNEDKSIVNPRLQWLSDGVPIDHWSDETGELSRSGIVRLPVDRDVTQIQCKWAGDFPWPAHRVILRIVPNAVRAEHALSARDAELDIVSVARKNQKDRSVFVATRELPADRNGFQTLDLKAPFVGLTVSVHSQTKARREWKHCQSLLSKGQDDQCYEIDGTVLRFGNGKYGAKLPEDCCVCVTCKVLEPTLGISVGTKWKPRWNPASTTEAQVRQEYEANKERAIVCTTIEAPPNSLPDDIDSKFQRQVVRLNASHELRLLAKENGDTLDGLSRRRVLEILAPEVAVAPTDYERLALETPAVRIMRARAVKEVDVDTPGLTGYGAISVLVLPDVNVPDLGYKFFPKEVIDLWKLVSNEPEKRDLRRKSLRESRKVLEERIQKECGSSIERVKAHLQAKQSMGGRLIVSSPKLSLFAVDLIFTSPNLPRMTPEKLLQAYLCPFTGGPNGTGLAWGKPILQGEMTTRLNETLRSMGFGDVTVSCKVQQLTKCFPWSMPLAVLIDSSADKRSGDA